MTSDWKPDVDPGTWIRHAPDGGCLTIDAKPRYRWIAWMQDYRLPEVFGSFPADADAVEVALDAQAAARFALLTPAEHLVAAAAAGVNLVTLRAKVMEIFDRAEAITRPGKNVETVDHVGGGGQLRVW